MFSRALETTLNLAFAHAKERNHQFLSVEHLLLALLDNPDVEGFTQAQGISIEALRTSLANHIDDNTPPLPKEQSRETQPTPEFQHVLQRAIFHVRAHGRAEVTGLHVLLAIFSEHKLHAVSFLSQTGISRESVQTYLNQLPDPASEDPNLPSMHEDPFSLDESFSSEGVPEEKQTLLDKYAINLNNKALKGDIDPVIGREEELMRTIQILCRRRKNNPLFVGEAGVGKTAIAEGLALKIVDNDVPDPIKNNVIYSLDLGILLAGTKYRGDFEKRFKNVLEELANLPNAVVFIDEIHTLVGAGAASGGSIDASNLIKPLLTMGNIRCMGATTYQEFRSIFAKDAALSRRFQKVDIKEPSRKETYKILKGLRKQFEEHHQVKFSRDALKAAADLADRYIHDRNMPDKAIDVIDETGAYQMLQPKTKRKKVIRRADIEATVAKLARVPSEHVTSTAQESLKNLERDLKMLIFGQDMAIEALCSAIKLARSGLRDQGKPVGTFLFAGPTGVGKTETAKQLADLLGIELLRFDMSEYMEQHSVARLIGAPPGYVGYEQGGLLTEALNKHPHSVLLLDEIEKAHPDVYNLMLQVMDYGKLTDNNGETADFSNVILIMTTNAGADQLNKPSVGFTEQDHSTDALDVINQVFTPEFRNRLDGVIQFSALGKAILMHVIEKFIAQLEVQLESKGVSVKVSDAAKEWLGKHGYDEKMGARPMQRIIDEHIKKPLAEELLFGKLSKGGTLVINAVDGEIALDMEPASSNS